MGRGAGFIGLVIVVAIVGYLYTSQLKQVAATTGGDAPATVISVTGVRNDLNAMAQSEQRYLVTHRGYASLDDLRTDGDIHVPSRPDFTYDIDAGADHFLITATYTGSDPKAPRHIRIDDTKAFTQD
jgi:Tfp pilus assembly protein PilE